MCSLSSGTWHVWGLAPVWTRLSRRQHLPYLRGAFLERTTHHRVADGPLLPLSYLDDAQLPRFVAQSATHLQQHEPGIGECDYRAVVRYRQCAGQAQAGRGAYSRVLRSTKPSSAVHDMAR
jgi:hypothetical protein